MLAETKNYARILCASFNVSFTQSCAFNSIVSVIYIVWSKGCSSVIARSVGSWTDNGVETVPIDRGLAVEEVRHTVL